MRLTPAVRISFGLVSLTVSLLLLGQLLGLAPDRNKGVLESRKNLSEFVAVQFSAAAGRGDYPLIRETLRSMVERDNDIKSAAMRSIQGDLLAEAGEHLAHWTPSDDGRSTATHVQIPIFKGNNRWATVEISFAPLWVNNILSGFKNSYLSLILFVACTGFAGYFLIIWDLVKFAKENNIPTGPGRGSAAGSLVSYLLGITEINPLEYGLLFERFLNPERVSMPDIDIDFCDEKRPKILEYVASKYGKENVAQIITFGTLQARAVVRDVGRVLGLSYSEVDRIAKLIPPEPNISLDSALQRTPQLRALYESDPKIRQLIDIAKKLEGLSRHASIHAAGVVISDKPLTDYIPLYKTSEGEITTGFSMGPLEKLGLLKMDFLGLKTLTLIEETLRWIKKLRGIDLDIKSIPLDDKKTYELLSAGKTIGVFQLESSGMRDLLRRLKPEKFTDLIHCLALYRPGPIGTGMVSDFIERKHGRQPVSYLHPKLEPVFLITSNSYSNLFNTCGVG